MLRKVLLKGFQVRGVCYAPMMFSRVNYNSSPMMPYDMNSFQIQPFSHQTFCVQKIEYTTTEEEPTEETKGCRCCKDKDGPCWCKIGCGFGVLGLIALAVILYKRRKKGLRVMIFGPPAGGKGTQCAYIKKKFGVYHLSTGDVLREHVKKDTELGRNAKYFMQSGKLVPDELVCAMVKERLERDDAKKKGWLLDGFPRTPAQAKFLIRQGLVPDVIISLQVPDAVCIERAVGRRMDPVTKKIYHIKYYPPQNEDIKKRLIQRKDDTKVAVKERISTFKKYLSLVDIFAGVPIIKVDGNRPKDKVWKDVSQHLNDTKKNK